MKNVKLAFSVYALTLALASNGAWAAIGQANPSCNANEFTIKYVVSKTGCEDANGFGYYNNGATADKVGNNQETWDANFTTPKLADYTEGKNLCLGADLVGWNGADLIDSVSSLEPGEEYTSDSDLWEISPLPNGSTEYTLNAVWRYNQSRISLDTNGAQYSGNPTALQRNGVDLLLSDTSSTPMSTTANKLTNLPQKHGYTFKGYFLEQDRATAVGNFWNTGADSYAEDAINCRASQSEWANEDGDVVKKCPWIASTGYLGSNFVGTAAAAIGTDSTLYAAWEPREYTYVYGFACGKTTQELDGRPGCADIGMDSSFSFKQSGRYGVTPSSYREDLQDYSGFYEFKGWDVSISYDGNTITKSFLNKNDKENWPDFSKIITEEDWQAIGDSTPNVLLIAKWGMIEPVYWKMYSYEGASEPFATYQMVISQKDYLGGTKIPVVSFYEMETDDDGNQVAVSSPLPAGTTITGPENATLRGFAILTKNATKAQLGTVDEDTEGLQWQSITDNTKPLLVGMRSMSNENDWKFSVDAARELHSGMGSGSEAVAYVQAITSTIPEGQNYVDVYGIWAQNCVLDTGDASCKMYLAPDARVSYVNTCLSGYNIDKQEGAGTEPTEDELENGGVFEADHAER